ncbi:hypothetical protein L9F63_022699, partial [Diploptera punctata]
IPKHDATCQRNFFCASNLRCNSFYRASHSQHGRQTMCTLRAVSQHEVTNGQLGAYLSSARPAGNRILLSILIKTIL